MFCLYACALICSDLQSLKLLSFGEKESTPHEGLLPLGCKSCVVCASSLPSGGMSCSLYFKNATHRGSANHCPTRLKLIPRKGRFIIGGWLNHDRLSSEAAAPTGLEVSETRQPNFLASHQGTGLLALVPFLILFSWRSRKEEEEGRGRVG